MAAVRGRRTASTKRAAAACGPAPRRGRSAARAAALEQLIQVPRLSGAKLVAAARRAEPIEAATVEAHWAVMPPVMSKKHPSRTVRLGGALLTIMKKSTSLTMNRVLNLGIEGEVKRSTIEELLQLYRDARVTRLTVHLAPSRQSEEIARWLQERGFRPHGQLAKFLREAAPAPKIETELTVRPITGEDEAALFGEILCANFGWPMGRAPWVAATVDQPGFTHFMAFSGSRPVATGMLFVHGRGGYLGWGSTLPAFRGGGAQNALIAARVKKALQLGCEWMSSDTFDPGGGRSPGSYRNFSRSGFEHVYSRPIFLWEEGK